MTIQNKISQNIYDVVDQIFLIRVNAFTSGKKVDTQKIDRVVNEAATRIRTDIVKEAVAKLDTTSFPHSKKIKKEPKLSSSTMTSVLKSVNKQQRLKKPLFQSIIKKSISDKMLAARIKQVISGNSDGITVNSLFQRLSNNRDIIGTNLQMSRVTRLINGLVNNNNNFIKKEGTGRYALLFTHE